MTQHFIQEINFHFAINMDLLSFLVVSRTRHIGNVCSNGLNFVHELITNTTIFLQKRETIWISQLQLLSHPTQQSVLKLNDCRCTLCIQMEITDMTKKFWRHYQEQWRANYGLWTRCGPLRGSIRPTADFKIIVQKFSISVLWKNSFKGMFHFWICKIFHRNWNIFLHMQNVVVRI